MKKINNFTLEINNIKEVIQNNIIKNENKLYFSEILEKEIKDIKNDINKEKEINHIKELDILYNINEQKEEKLNSINYIKNNTKEIKNEFNIEKEKINNKYIFLSLVKNGYYLLFIINIINNIYSKIKHINDLLNNNKKIDDKKDIKFYYKYINYYNTINYFISNGIERNLKIKQIKNYKLLFKASKDRYESYYFNYKCDRKNNKVTFIKTKKGRISGDLYKRINYKKCYLIFN